MEEGSVQRKPIYMVTKGFLFFIFYCGWYNLKWDLFVSFCHECYRRSQFGAKSFSVPLFFWNKFNRGRPICFFFLAFIDEHLLYFLMDKAEE